MNKAYEKINWENTPSTKTPLSAENLNKMDDAIDVIDDRVLNLDEQKANEADVEELVKDVYIDETTGDVTITKKNGTDEKYKISASGDATFEDLSYADYKAKNYDENKNYAIPDYPYLSGEEVVESKISIPSGVVEKLSDNTARRVGDVVQISIGFTNSTMTGNNIDITIPEGFRPAETRCLSAFGYLEGIGFSQFPILISATGAVSTDWAGAVLSQFYCNGTYIV